MSGERASAAALAVLALACAAPPAPAGAESLLDAIGLAYQTNPTLRAEEAALREVDEGYVQARSAFGPQVQASAQASYQGARIQLPPTLFGANKPTDYQAGTGSADLSVTQPLYTHGAAVAGVRKASADILAEREHLRQTEAEVLQAVITAYVDVRRDRATVGIIEDEITALSGEFDEIKAKGELGDLSKTDVAQAQARLLSARSQLDLAQGKLAASSAEYLSVVGENPGELAPEPELVGAPGTLDEAIDTAEHNNPQLLGAIDAERSAREDVAKAKAADGPTVALKLDGGVSPYEPYIAGQYDEAATATVEVSVPLFTSGYNGSKIRQALEADNRAQLAIEVTRRGVIQTIAQAWDELIANRQAIQLAESQVKAEQDAVEGYRTEERVGLRSTIDLLNAELEAADTRITLAQAARDSYVATATVLAQMGLLEAQLQDPGVPAADAAAHLRRVSGAGASPWEGAVQALDSLGAPNPRAPNVTPEDAGGERPAAAPGAQP